VRRPDPARESRRRPGLLLLGAAALLLAGAPARGDEAPADRDGFLVPQPGMPLDQTMRLYDRAPLWDWVDPPLQRYLEAAMAHLGLAEPIEQHKLAVALVDVTHLDRPRVAALNGDEMFYAASLPKIAIMLAVFQKAQEGGLDIDPDTWSRLERMIRRSSNQDATALMHRVGKPYIGRVLASPRYLLYDPARHGGLWAGKDYAQGGLWKRDPLSNYSHAATAMQVARFFYMLETGRLVSPEASLRMKELLAHSEIDHKFVKGLRLVRPDAMIYRKSGTWQDYHSDSALIERPDGVRYIAVALAESPDGLQWLPQIIITFDRMLPSPTPRTQTTQAGG
jgi:beta-lactamase class A